MYLKKKPRGTVVRIFLFPIKKSISLSFESLERKFEDSYQR